MGVLTQSGIRFHTGVTRQKYQAFKYFGKDSRLPTNCNTGVLLSLRLALHWPMRDSKPLVGVVYVEIESANTLPQHRPAEFLAVFDDRLVIVIECSDVRPEDNKNVHIENRPRVLPSTAVVVWVLFGFRRVGVPSIVVTVPFQQKHQFPIGSLERSPQWRSILPEINGDAHWREEHPVQPT